MTDAEFMNDSWEFLSQTMSMAQKKGVEYANGGDRLGNFKRAAAELDLDPKVIAAVYFKKHVDSIMQYVRTNDEGSLTESFEGRVADAIVYLLIIRAIDRDQSAIRQIEEALKLNMEGKVTEEMTDEAIARYNQMRAVDGDDRETGS